MESHRRHCRVMSPSCRGLGCRGSVRLLVLLLVLGLWLRAGLLLCAVRLIDLLRTLRDWAIGLLLEGLFRVGLLRVGLLLAVLRHDSRSECNSQLGQAKRESATRDLPPAILPCDLVKHSCNADWHPASGEYGERRRSRAGHAD